MPEIIEVAKTGRAKCRGCRQSVEKGALRFGEEQPSAFAEGLQMVWYHLACAAKKRPQHLRAALSGYEGEVPGRPEIERLLGEAEAKAPAAFPHAERAPTGRSKCLQCEQPIEKGGLRVAIEREVEVSGMTRTSAGYLHPACAIEHTGDEGLLDVVRANSKGLSEADLALISEQMAG